MHRRLMAHSLAVALLGLVARPADASTLPDFISGISAVTIAAISDGDFVAQTYATGRLAPREANYRDQLTVISIADGGIVTGSVPVSNSVTAAPEILALTPDAQTAFVTERLGERPQGAETVRELPPGNRLFAIDLADKANPRLADTAELAAFPEALAVDPDGTRVAVVANTPKASYVHIVPYGGGRFGEVARFDLRALGVAGNAASPRGGVTATSVDWHPSGRFIAVNIDTQNRVAFFEVTEAGGKLALRLWGNTVEVGPDPFVGRFTPDGRYYLTSDWGRNLTATDLEARLPDRRSSISVIRLAAPVESAETARHEGIGSAATDVAAEGIAVSADGALVATVNMRTTAFPIDSARFQREATVTLLTFDRTTGHLVKVADYPFEGVLPEGGTLDLTGDHFLATVFQGHEGSVGDQGAGLEVFRVVRGERPRLERLGRIPLPHGVHHVDVGRAARS